MNPIIKFVAAITLFLCIASTTASAGYFNFLGSNSPRVEYGVELVTDTPGPEAFLPVGKITASTVVSGDGIVREEIYLAPNGDVGEDDLEALRTYCQKNRMFLLLDCLDDMNSAELDTGPAGGNGMSVTANVSQGEAPSARGNFDDAIKVVDYAFFGMKDGCPYIGITDPYALQLEENGGRMLSQFDMFVAYYGIDDYRTDGLDEQIRKLAELEDQAANSPYYSSVIVTYEGNDDVAIENPITGRDQLDPQIYDAYLFEVEVTHRFSE